MTAGFDKGEYLLGNLRIYDYKRYNLWEMDIKLITGKSEQIKRRENDCTVSF